MVDKNYISVTEIAGDDASKDQIERLYNRYYWVGEYCRKKDIVEVACGTGQGLGYLSSLANSIEGGDYSKAILTRAREHYGDRIPLRQFDAQSMPYKDKSKDVIILLEAIYYLPDADKFVSECVRILRPGGKVLIATANKDIYDFNPSPHSYKYYGVVELRYLFERHNFKTEFFGDSPINRESSLQKILMYIKKFAVFFNLIPKTMKGKRFLKRIIFGKLVKLPAEITENTITYFKQNRISSASPDTTHKIIFCAATLTY